jgi:hypothetical protein
MGYMRHHAIVVTGLDGPHMSVSLREAHDMAVAVMGPALVSPVVVSTSNGYRSFLVAPDGSSEGWAESDESDDYAERRERYVAWLRSRINEDFTSSVAWVYLQYGDSNRETAVLDDSDAPIRAHPQPADGP